ncbi:hypothetical protein [Ruegeria sp. Ofav3-42]|uniref:hypothetical protein n=1 Tax=Ruegeria sp. Ofav3-42 TaxID=2917759 RepID=UPI001EF46EA4|nr:hypothetical protein [Ruegeria sp. Ofav3-42]MCG7521558.1 hypothetical protein [Ruegeria sp. Ofav3-42]
MTIHDETHDFQGFLIVSAALTGYDSAELQGTGCAKEYWHQFRQVLPKEILTEFLSFAPALGKKHEDKIIRQSYLSDRCLGPVSRSLIQLWYTGQWVPFPQEWRENYGASRFDVVKIISTRAYKEGLVWDAIGAHPQGAKQQGFGAWSLEPPKQRGAGE